jgi:hypothetical protein
LGVTSKVPGEIVENFSAEARAVRVGPRAPRTSGGIVERAGNDTGRRVRRRWTDEEERWLRRHRADGRAAVAAALGRSEEAVREKALRMGITVPVRPVPGEVCPMCGRHRVSPGTEAARAGMCQVCWARHKREVYEERQAELAEARAYDAAKKRAARRKGRP